MHCRSIQTLQAQLKITTSFRWNLKATHLSFEIHRSITDADKVVWNSMNRKKNVFLEYSYLEAISKALVSSDNFRFVIFRQSFAVKGIAVFHITNFETGNISSNISPEVNNSLAELLNRSVDAKRKKYDILICGNAFSTGENGYAFAKDVSSSDAMNALCYALTKVLKDEKTSGKKISAVVVKDFYHSSRQEAEALYSCGFRSFEVDQNMVMPLLPEWKSFNDYLDSLNTKFRTKANAALRKSANLTVSELDEKGMVKYRDDITRLYEEVYKKADFRLGKMTFDAFLHLKKNLGKKMIVRMYFCENRAVGFLSGMETAGKFEAHLVGINYQRNQQLAIYSRILYDYIFIAIERKLTAVLFGRTAGEIKSSVGAFPVSLQCCIRHPGKISNLLLYRIFAHIKPSGFPLRHPYKKVTLEKIKEYRLGLQL